jgi:hypothetical protein
VGAVVDVPGPERNGRKEKGKGERRFARLSAV